jgi:mono/diheme cytochrome c family protein
MRTASISPLIKRILVVALAAYVLAGCSGSISAGSSGSGGQTTDGSGRGTASGGSTGSGGPATGMPGDVQALLQTRCVGCHSNPPMNGAPIPLVTRTDLMALSLADPTQTVAQRALTRIQLTVGEMPPAPAARATAAEIQALGNWIASGYAAASCSSATGAGGAIGTGGSSGAGGGGGATNAGLPCNVQAVYQTHCTSCHAAAPVSGAPMPLVTRSNLTAPSFVDATMTFAQRTVVRMQSTTSPMPPAPGARVSTTEIQTVQSWISAGYPAGTCGTTGGGADAGPPDPLGATPTCTSGTTWTGGNNGSAVMNPGRACIACHAGNGEAPQFTIAGTVYPTGHEPDLCNGANGTNGARVVIVDAANRTVTLTPNAAGNFTYTGAVTTPYTAKVTYQGRERIMPAAQTSGDCNSCHTQNGANGAPGRITLP